MKISKLRFYALICMMAAILLGIVEGITQERLWTYIQIVVMISTMILVIIDGIVNKDKKHSKYTWVYVVAGIVMLILLLGMLIIYLII